MTLVTRATIQDVLAHFSPTFPKWDGNARIVAFVETVALVHPVLVLPPDGTLVLPFAIRVTSSGTKVFLVHCKLFTV